MSIEKKLFVLINETLMSYVDGEALATSMAVLTSQPVEYTVIKSGVKEQDKQGRWLPQNGQWQETAYPRRMV
ncbi:MAG: hypothetical protein ACXQS4_05030 [Methermicoccaceae archaeon]